MYRIFGKRLLDLMLVIPAIIIALPIGAVLILQVRWQLGSPVLFRQQRPGYQGQPFTIQKFRTMTGAIDSDGNLLPDSKRLTRFGRFLRSTSLDELPELINVLKGDMSLVGPRPLLMEYLDLYTTEQMRRHEVRPGITGWAQINGRNTIAWEEKFVYDNWYVDHYNLRLDLRILFLTLLAIIKREGITQPGEATIQPFTGSES